MNLFAVPSSLLELSPVARALVEATIAIVERNLALLPNGESHRPFIAVLASSKDAPVFSNIESSLDNGFEYSSDAQRELIDALARCDARACVVGTTAWIVDLNHDLQARGAESDPDIDVRYHPDRIEVVSLIVDDGETQASVVVEHLRRPPHIGRIAVMTGNPHGQPRAYVAQLVRYTLSMLEEMRS